MNYYTRLGREGREGVQIDIQAQFRVAAGTQD